jgi:hypothetical protein
MTLQKNTEVCKSATNKQVVTLSRHGAKVTSPLIKLLLQWQDDGRFGLTVPFLYGALDSWPDAPLGTSVAPEAKFGRMLEIAANEAAGTVIRLFHCPTVSDLTFALIPSVPDYCIPIRSSADTSSTLWVQKGLVIANAIDPPTLAVGIWDRYSHPIIEERYSRRGGAYLRFSESDLTFIQRAIAREDLVEDP